MAHLHIPSFRVQVSPLLSAALDNCERAIAIAEQACAALDLLTSQLRRGETIGSDQLDVIAEHLPATLAQLKENRTRLTDSQRKARYLS